MKLQKLHHLIALGAVLAFATAGCRHTPVGVTPINGHGGTSQVPNDGGPIVPANPNFGQPTAPTQPINTGQPPLDAGTKISGNPAGGTDTKTEIGPGGIAPAPTEGWDTATANTEILHADTIYFDFDKSAVKASEQSKLNEVAAYWKANPSNGIRVEGNCDERGTDEYNRSLGDRRAMAAREYLVSQGVDPKFILTVSYGKDKPVDPGHNEEAWSKNRRDDFVVLIKPGGKP